MKFQNIRAALFGVFAFFVAMLPSDGALAQVVSQQPAFITPNAVTDLGNGPLELKALQGNGFIASYFGTATSTTVTASTTMVLTATPTIPPCVGCIISGAGITSGTTVAAYNGTTTITLSASMTVANNTPVAFGAACPTAPAPTTVSMAPVGVGTAGPNDFPFYTQARLCGYATFAPGLQVLSFPIGAH